jgi:alpha-L-arabinofuranosidase
VATSLTYYVKIAYYDTTSQCVTVKIPAAGKVSTTARLQTFTEAATQSNYLLDVTVLPVASTVRGSLASGWTFSVPGYGIAFLTVSL